MSIFIIAMIATLLLLAVGSAMEQRTKRAMDDLDKALEAKRRFRPTEE